FGSGGHTVTSIGTQAAAYGVTQQTDGKILLGGASQNNGLYSFTLARYLNSAPPMITATAKNADNTIYTAGSWTNQSVTVSFSCVAQSGIETNTVAGATVSSEGANQSVTNTGTCVDTAGRVAPAATFGPINIDKTPPVITATARNADKSIYTAGTWTN